MGDLADKILEKGLGAFGKIQAQFRPPHVKAIHIRDAEKIACAGSIICRKYGFYLDTLVIPGEFSHSGILESATTVIHAVGEGVERIDIIDFIKDCDGFIILHPKEEFPYDFQKAVGFARAQIGKPYDFKMTVEGSDVKALFCHELSGRSLWAGGIKIPPVIKSFGPVKHEVYLADMFVSDPRVRTLYRTPF